ncbi:SPOR domain-containing protein [Persephonella sp.]
MKRRYLITALVSAATLASIEILSEYSIDFETFSSYREAKEYIEKLPPIFRDSLDLVKNEDGNYSIRYTLFNHKAFKTLLPLGLKVASAQSEAQVFQAKEEYLYSLQLASFKRKESAEKFLEKLPPEIRENAFIYKTNSGYYTVRYGMFDSYKLIKEVQKTFPLESILVKSLISKVAEYKRKKAESEAKTAEKPLEKKEEAKKEETKIETVTPSVPTPPSTVTVTPETAEPSVSAETGTETAVAVSKKEEKKEEPISEKIEEEVAKEVQQLTPEETPAEKPVKEVTDKELEETPALDIAEFEEEEELTLFEEEKIEIPLYKKILGGLLFIPAYMWTHKQRGFWGKIEFTYKRESYKDQYRKTTRDSFKQYYELNYDGFIYSPRLLTYKLGVSFLKEDSNINTGTYESKSTSKLIGYDIDMQLLKSSRFPINIFAKKTQSPLWYTYYDRTSYIERTSNSYGIFGSVNLETSRVSYGYKNTKADSVGLDFQEYRRTKEYMLSYGKTEANQSINITYQKNIDDYIQKYLTIDSYRTVYQDINNLKIDYNYKPSKTAQMRAFARYYTNSYTNLKDYSGNVNFSWTPSDKLFANVSLNLSRNESSFSDITYITFNENVSYIMNENWNMTHNLLLFVSRSSTGDVNLANTGVNFNYNRQISDTLNIFGGFGVSGQLESNRVDRYGGTLSVNAGLGKKFSFLDTQFTLSGSGSTYRSSKDDSSDTYSLNERFVSNISRSLKFEHYTTYYYQDSKYYVKDNEFSRTSYENFETSNSIRYYTKLGWKGVFGSGAGFKYYKGKNRKERFYPFGNINLTYKFTRRLLYKFSLDVYRDTYYNKNYAVAKTGVDYRIRSLYFNWNLQYYYEDSDYYGKRRNYVTYLKVYRPF